MRALGYTVEADALEAALYANPPRIVKGDPSQMNGLAMVATSDGYLIINESFWNRLRRYSTYTVMFRSFLIHEGLHLWQWKNMWENYDFAPSGFVYDRDAMEADAYDRQIQYIEFLLQTMQNEKKRKELEELLAFLKKNRDKYHDLIGTRRGKPKLPRGSSGFGAPIFYPPRYNRYYSNDVTGNYPELGTQEIIDRTRQDVLEGEWAGFEGVLLSAYSKRIQEGKETLVNFDSHAWDESDYRDALGSQFEADDVGDIAALSDLTLRIFANPAYIGVPISQIPLGVPLFIFEDTSHQYRRYGFDRNGQFCYYGLLEPPR